MSELDILVIYSWPDDFPHTPYVIRRQAASAGRVESGPAWSALSLGKARAIVQTIMPGAVRIERSPDDVPAIVECWL